MANAYGRAVVRLQNKTDEFRRRKLLGGSGGACSPSPLRNFTAAMLESLRRAPTRLLPKLSKFK